MRSRLTSIFYEANNFEKIGVVPERRCLHLHRSGGGGGGGRRYRHHHYRRVVVEEATTCNISLYDLTNFILLEDSEELTLTPSAGLAACPLAGNLLDQLLRA